MSSLCLSVFQNHRSKLGDLGKLPSISNQNTRLYHRETERQRIQWYSRKRQWSLVLRLCDLRNSDGWYRSGNTNTQRRVTDPTGRGRELSRRKINRQVQTQSIGVTEGWDGPVLRTRTSHPSVCSNVKQNVNRCTRNLKDREMHSLWFKVCEIKYRHYEAC